MGKNDTIKIGFKLCENMSIITLSNPYESVYLSVRGPAKEVSIVCYPANTKHLYNIYRMLDQRRSCINVI